MNFMQSLWEALGSLTTNKLRSGLTILGIVIGVASVIAMVALGRGVQNSVTGQMAGVGTNQLTIFSMGNAELRNPQPLTLDDAQAIQDQLSASGVRQVASQLSGSALISYGSESATSNIYGVSANFGSVNNLDVIEGRFLTEEDMAGQTSSVVIGSKLAISSLTARAAWWAS
jgi:putative ABC transport system permease protein